MKKKRYKVIALLIGIALLAGSVSIYINLQVKNKKRYKDNISNAREVMVPKKVAKQLSSILMPLLF